MNIIRIILAWLLALITALTTTSCGNIAAEDDAPNNESITAESADSSEADESSQEDSLQEESSQEEQPESKPEPEPTENNRIGRIDPSKLIVNDEYMYEDSDRPDDDTLIGFAELAITQYEACRDQDKQGYLDTLSLAELIKSDSAKLMFDYMQEDEFEAEISRAEGNAVAYDLMLIYSIAENDDSFQSGLDELSDDKAIVEYISEYTAGLTVENCGALFENSLFGTLNDRELGYSDGSFFADPSAYTIDDPIVFIELDCCAVNERGTFAEFDMEILSGEYYYSFGEIYAWKTADSGGIYVSDLRCEPNDLGIYTIDDVNKMMHEGALADEAKSNAKAVYDGLKELYGGGAPVSEFFSELSQAVDEGFFSKASSPNGLDLSGKSPDSEGDRNIYDIAKKEGIINGYIYIGLDNNINGSPGFFIQWRESKDSSVIGQYPCFFDYYNADVKWGSYYH